MGSQSSSSFATLPKPMGEKDKTGLQSHTIHQKQELDVCKPSWSTSDEIQPLCCSFLNLFLLISPFPQGIAQDPLKALGDFLLEWNLN